MKNKLIYISLVLFLFSCSKKEEQENISMLPNYIPEQPGLKEYHTNPDVIALGKQLFFDPILSADSSISCASCHLREKAFSDGVALSNIGISGETLVRNAPALFNIGWHTSFFWEGGAKDLESQALGPLTSEHEMGKDLVTLEKQLNNHISYPEKFRNAFSVSEIKINEVMKALAAFQRSLTSFNSKYDYVLQGKATFSTSEKRGYTLVQQHCSSCHTEPLFSSFNFENNGLDSEFSYSGEDERLGRYRITFNEEDLGKYKIPSLRNLAFTSPYMHDGRLNTLDDVLDHYSSSIKESATLSAEIPNSGFNFTTEEIADIKDFLNTLNDENFLSE